MLMLTHNAITQAREISLVLIGPGHKIPKDSGNGYLMGIEIASKGKKNDFTEAQWQTLTKLAMTLKELYGWKDLSTYYFPRHKDWAGSRKNDIQASNKFVQGKFEEYGQLWDGKVPPYDSVLAAQADQTLAIRQFQAHQ